MLRKLLRFFHGETQGEQALRAMFASMPQVLQAIHMEEVGLPNGRSTTIQWLSCGQSTTSRICVRSDRSKPFEWRTLDRSSLEFTQLMRTVRELDSQLVASEASQIRDGVVYFVSWGDGRIVNSRTLRNPKAGSKSLQLVAAIKATAEAHLPEIAGQVTLP